MTVGTDERFVVISADCHAGGSMDTYGEYLEDEYQERFAEWRGAYAEQDRWRLSHLRMELISSSSYG